ncbi:hypothetical protein PC9H_010148 [Pleurotus ostreatus]|uniref:CCHC-type domain-containing protein n=1 Tax=Pleurotus ostreatus TaxID=5322 RepID=A0A8H6ZR20_PLEOS|nr:uncharacterized protein PC9H_010148 [Pleurotus ostreatus]KAF7424837.1 hypothetical protein PC9H_010148 [Pleurotus ostreatus]
MSSTISFPESLSPPLSQSPTSLTAQTTPELHMPALGPDPAVPNQANIPTLPLPRNRDTEDETSLAYRTYRYAPEMMPMIGERGAPPLFKGSHEKITSFLKKYNALCTRYSITRSADKCERVLDYCSDKVSVLVEALPGFRQSSWSLLQAEMEKHFDADRKEKRNTTSKLAKHTNYWSSKKIKSLTKWKQYERKFISKSGWLRKTDKITEELEATYFWLGIHPDARQKIENRLLARHPRISVKKAFPMALVSEIAQEIFERDRFEYNLIDVGSDSENSSDSDSDSESSDDSEDEKRTRAKIKALKARKSAKSKSKKSKTHDLDSDPVTENLQSPKEYSSRKSKTIPPEDKVEGLIKKMSQMSLDDPEYSTTYYRAFCLDERITKICPPPNVGQRQPVGNMGPPRNRFPPPIPPRVNSSTLPPTSSSNPTPTSSPPAPNMTPRPPMTCYGCGEQGHGIARCAPVADLINRRVVVRTPEGRITWPNGALIYREQGEYLVQSVQRITSQSTPVTSNFVMSTNPDCYISATGKIYEIEDDSASEEEEEENEILAVERNSKTVTMNRKDLERGAVKSRPVLNEDTGRRTRSKGPVPDPKPSSSAPRSRPNPVVPVIPTIPDQTPIDARVRQEFTVEDVTMTDELPKSARKPAPETKPLPSDPTKPNKAPISRQSEILPDPELDAILERALALTLPITLGEYFGISKQAREHLAKMFKGKTMKIANEHSSPSPVAMVESESAPQTLQVQLDEENYDRASLIVVPMRFGNEVIQAVIDSGSQLNIIHADTFKKSIHLPVDTNRIIKMNDANGGTGELRGYVQNVHLTCGSVETVANLYLGEKAPFKLLLGRPWQRANRVSIEERNEGTYLIFRPKNETTCYELLVLQSVLRPDQMLQGILCKENSMLASMMIHVPPTPTTSKIEELENDTPSFLDQQPTADSTPPPAAIKECIHVPRDSILRTNNPYCKECWPYNFLTASTKRRITYEDTPIDIQQQANRENYLKHSEQILREVMELSFPSVPPSLKIWPSVPYSAHREKVIMTNFSPAGPPNQGPSKNSLTVTLNPDTIKPKEIWSNEIMDEQSVQTYVGWCNEKSPPASSVMQKGLYSNNKAMWYEDQREPPEFRQEISDCTTFHRSNSSNRNSPPSESDLKNLNEELLLQLDELLQISKENQQTTETFRNELPSPPATSIQHSNLLPPFITDIPWNDPQTISQFPALTMKPTTFYAKYAPKGLDEEIQNLNSSNILPGEDPGLSTLPFDWGNEPLNAELEARLADIAKTKEKLESVEWRNKRRNPYSSGMNPQHNQTSKSGLFDSYDKASKRRKSNKGKTPEGIIRPLWTESLRRREQHFWNNSQGPHPPQSPNNGTENPPSSTTPSSDSSEFIHELSDENDALNTIGEEVEKFLLKMRQNRSQDERNYRKGYAEEGSETSSIRNASSSNSSHSPTKDNAPEIQGTLEYHLAASSDNTDLSNSHPHITETFSKDKAVTRKDHRELTASGTSNSNNYMGGTVNYGRTKTNGGGTSWTNLTKDDPVISNNPSNPEDSGNLRIEGRILVERPSKDGPTKGEDEEARNDEFTTVGNMVQEVGKMPAAGSAAQGICEMRDEWKTIQEKKRDENLIRRAFASGVSPRDVVRGLTQTHIERCVHYEIDEDLQRARVTTVGDDGGTRRASMGEIECEYEIEHTRTKKGSTTGSYGQNERNEMSDSAPKNTTCSNEKASNVDQGDVEAVRHNVQNGFEHNETRRDSPMRGSNDEAGQIESGRNRRRGEDNREIGKGVEFAIASAQRAGSDGTKRDKYGEDLGQGMMQGSMKNECCVDDKVITKNARPAENVMENDKQEMESDAPEGLKRRHYTPPRSFQNDECDVERDWLIVESQCGANERANNDGERSRTGTRNEGRMRLLPPERMQERVSTTETDSRWSTDSGDDDLRVQATKTRIVNNEVEVRRQGAAPKLAPNEARTWTLLVELDDVLLCNLRSPNTNCTENNKHAVEIRCDSRGTIRNECVRKGNECVRNQERMCDSQGTTCSGNVPGTLATKSNGAKMNLGLGDPGDEQRRLGDLDRIRYEEYFLERNIRGIKGCAADTDESSSQKTHPSAPLRPQTSYNQQTQPHSNLTNPTMSTSTLSSNAVNNKDYDEVKELLAKLPISVRVSEAIKVLHESGKPPTVRVDKITQPQIALPMTLAAASPGEETTVENRIRRYAAIQQASTDDQAHQVVGVMTSANFIEHQEYQLPNGKVCVFLATDVHMSRRSTADPKEVQCNYGHAYIVLSQPNEPEKPQPEAALALSDTVTHSAAIHSCPSDFLHQMVGIEGPETPLLQNDGVNRREDTPRPTISRGLMQPPSNPYRQPPTYRDVAAQFPSPPPDTPLARKVKGKVTFRSSFRNNDSTPNAIQPTQDPRERPRNRSPTPFPHVRPPSARSNFPPSSRRHQHSLIPVNDTMFNDTIGVPIPSVAAQRHILEEINQGRIRDAAAQFLESTTRNQVADGAGTETKSAETQGSPMSQDVPISDSIASTPTLDIQTKSPIIIEQTEAPPSLIFSTQTANNSPNLSSMELQYPHDEIEVPATPTPSADNNGTPTEDIAMTSLPLPNHHSSTSSTSSPHSTDSIMAQGRPSPESSLEENTVKTVNVPETPKGKAGHTKSSNTIIIPPRYAKKPWKFNGPPTAPAKLQNTLARRTRSKSKKSPSSPPPPSTITQPLSSLTSRPFRLYHNEEEAVMVFDSDDENAEIFRNGFLIDDGQGNLSIQVPYSEEARNLMATLQSEDVRKEEIENVSPEEPGPSTQTTRTTRNMRKRKAKANKKATQESST